MECPSHHIGQLRHSSLPSGSARTSSYPYPESCADRRVSLGHQPERPNDIGINRIDAHLKPIRHGASRARSAAAASADDTAFGHRTKIQSGVELGLWQDPELESDLAHSPAFCERLLGNFR